MYYTIYKITNTENGKYYIGKHQTHELADGYFGSGIAIKEAIKKYGKSSFKKEILYIVSSADMMDKIERELITEDIVSDPMSYNLGVGGEGGPHFLGKTHTNETKQKLADLAKNRVVSEETRNKLSENNWSKKDPSSQREHARTIASKPKSIEHRESIRSKAIENGFGLWNSSMKREKIECPHCTKSGSKNTMYRWHFDKCKYKTKL